MNELKNILWDFDGVILDSMPIRDEGFNIVFKEYHKDQVGKLMNFHRKNGGLSRYVKIRYFFEEVLEESITEDEVNDWASRFSEIMLKRLIDPGLFIQDTLSFIKTNCKQYNMHIVSGSDQNELKEICKSLEIDKYFLSINGSPTPKKELVANVMSKHQYRNNDTIIIGDSMNDYDAAKANGITFYGYNNLDLKEKGLNYLHDYLAFSK